MQRRFVLKLTLILSDMSSIGSRSVVEIRQGLIEDRWI